MSNVKERILGAVTIMSDADAEIIWNLIQKHFVPLTWDDVEEVEPDEWDLELLKNIEENSDCKEFMSSEEALKELGL